jgi:hypothetical protein
MVEGGMGRQPDRRRVRSSRLGRRGDPLKLALGGAVSLCCLVAGTAFTVNHHDLLQEKISFAAAIVILVITVLRA